MWATCTGFLLALAVQPITSPRGPGEASHESLEGEWEIVGMVYKGKTQETKRFPNLGTMRIEGRTLRRTWPEAGWEDFGITLRPDKKPKEIDLHHSGGVGVLRGIYKFEEGTLTIVYPGMLRGERPKAFDAIADTGLTSFTLRRRVGFSKSSAKVPGDAAEVKPGPKDVDDVAVAKPGP